MAHGVPEIDVFQAADAVLTRGERPTVERVRMQLGRGSPARVGQLLEQWWEQLAQRLKGHALLPELPGETAQAFVEVWRLALAHAEMAASAAVAEDQNALLAAQTTLTQERKLWEIALAEAQAHVAESTAQRAQAESQLCERQILVDQLEAQCTDLLQQRDRLQAQLDAQHAELHASRVEHATAQEHVRTVEDRAHQQVDQARQEVKALQHQREREQREHSKVITRFTTEQDALRAAMHKAEQEAARQIGRVTALEATLIRWQGAITSGESKAKRTKPPKKSIQSAAKPKRTRTRGS